MNTNTLHETELHTYVIHQHNNTLKIFTGLCIEAMEGRGSTVGSKKVGALVGSGKHDMTTMHDNHDSRLNSLNSVAKLTADLPAEVPTTASTNAAGCGFL